MDRTINVGSISAEQAISYGFTGPNLCSWSWLRCTRTALQLLWRFRFYNPCGTSRYLWSFLRNAEVWQSISIIRQALEKCLREMNFMLTFLTITYLRKKMYTSMEFNISLKIVMGEILFQLQKYTIL
jgi:NADH-quinone oxidoreductase subunit D